ncbi:MAG: peptide deformylase [Bacteroidaceae bacterium]|nr:peptide deformylase [Bacteroidaceae bacterium]MBQ8676042.1 peptide deformylase [Bacteroidaceae bacterium]
MILPMYILGQPMLRKHAEEVPADYPKLQELIQNMFETMQHADGVGLAAPQVGLPLRLFVIDLNALSDDMPQYKDFLHAYINPTIVEASEDTETMEEGCLSVPGIHENVRRPKTVHVTYLDEQLQPHDEWLDGFLARVFQHEYDHLQGKLFIDHISSLRKQLIKKKLLAMTKGRVSCSYKVKS